MALSALEIYKFLPKTNCKKCGQPTCLAFAMKLAAKQIELSQCPFLTEDAKQKLNELSEPPMRTVTFGTPEKEVKIGGDLVLFRHEKKFYNPTPLGIILDSSDEKLEEKINYIKELRIERVGEEFKIDFLAIKDSGELSQFITAVNIISHNGFPLILISDSRENISSAVRKLKGHRPIVYYRGEVDDIIDFLKESDLPFIISDTQSQSLWKKAEEIYNSGFKNVILHLESSSLNELLKFNTIQRRLAILKGKRFASFPTLILVDEEDIFRQLALCSLGICKYTDVLISSCLDKALWNALVTLRFNIYTDPQKPVTVEPKVYSIGTPSENSPVLVTTNFSLTYYTVAPEIENSKIPSYLLVVDTEGMSVLTAWAADKFNEKVISSWMERENLKRLVNHRRLIIPGYVAVLSGKLEEVTGWEIIVGPKEASGIPKFLKQIWRN